MELRRSERVLLDYIREKEDRVAAEIREDRLTLVRDVADWTGIPMEYVSIDLKTGAITDTRETEGEVVEAEVVEVEGDADEG